VLEHTQRKLSTAGTSVRPETILGFYDELLKMGAALSAEQMQRHAAKAVKRGWSAARESKSIGRLLSRDSRPAHYAAEAAKKVRNAAAFDKTVSSKRPKYHEPAAASHAETFFKKLKGRIGKKTTGALGVGVGGVGAGEVEHHRHKKQEQEAA